MSSDPIQSALGKKSKADLIAWILETAERSEEIQRALQSWACPQMDSRALASRLRKQITSTWAKVRKSRNPHRMASATASDLEPVLAGIESLLERGEAQTAESLLRRFVEACEPCAGQIDDSNGRLWPVLQEGVALWGRAWTILAPQDLEPLICMVKEGVLKNEYSVRDFMIRDFAEALGIKGMRTLEQIFREQYELDRRDPDLASYSQGRCLRHLADLADGLGDPDLYLEAQTLGSCEDAYALPIGRRLMDAGRHGEAILWLERAAGARNRFPGESETASTLWARALLALGRRDEAREVMWGQFSETLGQGVLEELAEWHAPEDRVDLMQRALDCAEQHRSALTGAGFLLEHGEAERAAALVVSDPERFPGDLYPSMIRLAEQLAPVRPAAAWHLWRNLTDHILGEGRARAYPHAAKYLKQMRIVATQADTQAAHQQWESELRSAHGLKRSFWKHVEP